jgi:asparagine synthase (glutamine-hydrolysing)
MFTGFTARAARGGVTLDVFGDPSPALVQTAQDAAGHAVLMGRLYYREDLRERLGPEAPAGGANDAALALAAYQARGPAGLADLEGDFSLALFDARTACLIGVRDPFGAYPLFWSQAGGSAALGTSLWPLTGPGPAPALDEDYLADYLMLPGAYLAEVDGERTACAGLRRVPAGSLVRLDLRGGPVARRELVSWESVEARPDRPEDVEDLGRELLHLLGEAVRQRCGSGPMACHLSGGMDSTAVAALAHAAVAGGTPPLHTLTLGYETLPALAGEAAYANLALERMPGVVAHRVRADDLLEYDSFGAPPPHDEPCPALGCMGTEQALLDLAARQGCRTVLTGFGADELFDVPPVHVADLLRQGDVRGAWRESAAWARAAGTSRLHFLWRCGLSHLLPAWAQDGWGPLLRGGRAPWRGQTERTVAPWVRPDFARRLGLRERALAGHRKTYPPGQPVRRALALAEIRSRVGDPTNWYLAAPRGLVQAHPFLDPRVVRFGLAVRAALVPRPGQPKPVLASAARGLLPEEVRTRVRKCGFDEAAFLGLRRNRRALEDLIDQAAPEAGAFLDKGALLECLHLAALGVAGHAALDRLALTLSLLRWLSLRRDWARLARPARSFRWGPPAGEPPLAGRMPLASACGEYPT